MSSNGNEALGCVVGQVQECGGRIYQQTFIDTYSRVATAKLYYSLEELQVDLDVWLEKYNRERPHSGRYCYGKPPISSMPNDPFKSPKHLSHSLTIPPFHNSRFTSDLV